MNRHTSSPADRREERQQNRSNPKPTRLSPPLCQPPWTGGTSVVGLLIENPLGCKSYESFTLNVNPNGIASLSPAISKPAVNPK
jgi:hypothetical protein